MYVNGWENLIRKKKLISNDYSINYYYYYQINHGAA